MSKPALAASLLDELQTALAHGTVARRVETLRRVTDLFLDNAVPCTDELLTIFDDVFECLVVQMEGAARVLLAQRLAPLDSAPPRIVRTPAFDDLIEVAAPLLSRAEPDDALATCVGLRPSIPRHHYLQLVASASASVSKRLQAAHPHDANEISHAVAEVTRRAREASAGLTSQSSIAHGLVRLRFEEGRLDEAEVSAFAEAGKFDETSAAMAFLANVPVSVAETMMIESRNEGIFVLSKVAGFSWPTVKAIIRLRGRLSGGAQSVTDIDRDLYERLRLSTAQQVLRFHRMQQATSQLPA